MKKVVIEISAKTVIFTVAFLLFLKFLWIIKDILFSLFIAFILRSALMPLVIRLRKLRVPHFLSVILVFIGFLGSLLAFVSLLFPPLFVEISNFASTVPYYIDALSPQVKGFVNFDNLSTYIPNVTSFIFGFLGGFFSNALFVFITLFFSLYFLIQENFVRDLLVNFMEEEKIIWAVEFTKKIERRLAAWLWGEILLMFIIGVATYIGLSILQIRYALALAVIAGLLEVVPNIGPVIATVPAFLIGLTQSLISGISVVALYFVIQQFENTLIVPLVMKKAVGLNPIVTLLSLLIGGRIGGVVGILLAIPFTLFIETLLIEIVKRK